MKLTAIARIALLEMLNAVSVSTNVSWDIGVADSGFDPLDNPNASYNRLAREFINTSAIVKIVDAYQWYNSQILRILAAKDPSAVSGLEQIVVLSRDDKRRITAGEDKMVIIAERAAMRDRVVREYMHNALQLWEEAEMNVLVTIRNCICHHLGRDHRGEVEEWLRSGRSPHGLKKFVNVSGGQIEISDGAPDCATHVGHAQISICDQMAANRFGLELVEGKVPSIKRSRRGP